MREPSHLAVPRELPRLIRKMAETAYGPSAACGELAKELDWTEERAEEVLDLYSGGESYFDNGAEGKNLLPFPRWTN